LHAPGPIDTIRQIRDMTGGASYLTPADLSRINKHNVPPVREQPPQLSQAVPPNERYTPKSHPAHAVARAVLQSHKSPTRVAGTSPAHTGAGQGGGSGSSLNPMALLTGMVTALMRGGSPNQLLDPNSLSDAAAAPSTALAGQLQSALDGLPDAKAQALANIENWYGQVTSAEKSAANKDSTMANDLASAMSDNAKGIASGLGGSAMAGSAQIGAMGANDSNAMKAIGASDASLADELAPIFALSTAGAKNMMSGKYDSAKTDLLNQLATANGQASADKAAALMSIVGANNKTRQDNFSNEAGLLNTLASLQISGANAATKAQSASILNALHAAEAKKAAGQSVGGFEAATSAQKAKVAQDITNALVDTNTGKLKSGFDWPSALRSARNIVRTNGWNPLSPGVVSTIIGPALGMAGVQFQNPNALFQP